MKIYKAIKGKAYTKATAMKVFKEYTDIDLIQNPTLQKALEWHCWNLAGVSGVKEIRSFCRGMDHVYQFLK